MRATRTVNLFVAGALVMAACSASDDSTATDEGEPASSSATTADATGDPGSTEAPTVVAPGPTTGLTESEIRVGVMVPDFGVLAGTGLVPELGDVEDQVQAYVDHLNEGGGIAGRQIVASYHTFDPADFSGATSQTACLEATEDDPVFVVVGMPAWQLLGTICAAADHATPIISQTEITPAIYEQTQGRAFSIGMDLVRLYRAWATELDRLGRLEGKTIGVIVSDDNIGNQEAVEDGLIPGLEDLGYEIASKVVLPCESLACELHDVGVEQLRAAGVDFLFDALSPVASPTFLEAAAGALYAPETTFHEVLMNDTVAGFHQNVASVIDGMLAVGTYGPPNPGEPFEASDFQVECNQIYADAYGVEPHSQETAPDAFGMTSSGCAMLEIIKRGAEAVDELGQDSLVAGIESLGETTFLGFGSNPCDPAERTGSFGPGKHDLSNYVNVLVYDGETAQFLRQDPCRWTRVPDGG